MENHQKFMSRCLQLAETAAKEGESPVGSILVKNGKIIGEGSEKNKQTGDVTRHAEIVAILDALRQTDSLQHATLYTNMEPCVMCSYAIRHHKIKRVVILNRSQELGGTQKPYNILTLENIKSWSRPPEIIFLQDLKK